MLKRGLLFIHSPTLPLSVRIKEIVEKRLKSPPEGWTFRTVDWHKERDLAKIFCHYPPRIVILRDDNCYIPLDHICPEDLDWETIAKISQEEDGISLEDDPGPSWKGVTDVILDELSKNVLFFFDPYNAGFGHSPKLPNIQGLLSSLCLWLLERDIRYRKIVEETVDVILHSPMYRDGLVSTFSYSPSWDEPSEESTVLNQAEMAILLFMAAKSIPKRAYLDRALEVLAAAQRLSLEAEGSLSAFALARAHLVAHQAHVDNKGHLDKALRLLESHTPGSYIGEHIERLFAYIELYQCTGSYVEEITSSSQELVARFLTKAGVFKDSLLDIPERYGVEENAKAAEALIKAHVITKNEELFDVALSVVEKMAKKAIDSGLFGLYMIIPTVLALQRPAVIKLYGKDPEMLLAAYTFLNPLRLILHIPSRETGAELCFSDRCFPKTRDPNQLRDYIVSLTVSGML